MKQNKLIRSRSSLNRIIANTEKTIKKNSKVEKAFTGLPINKIKMILMQSGEFSTITVDHIDESTTNFIARSNSDKANFGSNDIFKLMKVAKATDYSFDIIVDNLKTLRFTFTEGFNRGI